MRALECPKCGAPLKSAPVQGVVRCTYCGTQVVASAPVPRPAQPLPAGKSVLTPALLVIPLVVVLLGSLAAYGMFARRGGNVPGIGGGVGEKSDASSKDLAAIGLDQAPARVAQRFGKTVADGKRIDLVLSDSSFKRASLLWEDPNHVTTIILTPRDGSIPGQVVERLGSQLGRAFRGKPGSQAVNVDGAALSLSSGLHVSAHGRDDPRWKARLQALWQAAQHAAFGTVSALDAKARRDSLNLDYDLADVAKIDPNTSVDDSARVTREVFPGAVTRGSAQVVGVSHPWFDSANISWKNEAGGKLWILNLYFVPELNGKPPYTELRRCLEPLFGAPKEQVLNHVAKDVALDWMNRGKLPRVYSSKQLVMVFHEDKTPRSEWQRTVARLAECR